jgi:hypothetical protein
MKSRSITGAGGRVFVAAAATGAADAEAAARTFCAAAARALAQLA